jgi:hypothetical protein
MDTIQNIIGALFGFALFGAAWHIHSKYRMTRLASLISAAAGFIAYVGPAGVWLNNWLGQAPLLLFLGVLIGLVVIVADIKGKRKGADKPALVAFFLVPLFFIGFLAALPAVGGMLGDGLEKAGENATTQLSSIG